MTPNNLALNFASNDQSVPGTLSLSADGLTVTFTPAAALAAGTRYYVQVSNVTDLAANTVTLTDSYFTTGP